MNLLIEEFALRCKEYKLQVDGARVDFDYKKFAELIVQECADIALKKGMASPDTDFRTGSYVINQYLLTHFGVEE